MQGWEIYNSNGSTLSMASVNGEAKLSFGSSQGNDWWDCQFFQKNIYVDQGKYQISFDIKSSVDAKIHFDIENYPDYDKKYVADTILDVSTEYQTYTYTFDVISENILGSTSNIRFQLNVGPEGNTSLIGENLYLDNVKIIKLSDVVTDGNLKEATVNFDLDKVITEDYKGLGVQWDPYQEHPLTDEEWDMVTKRVDYLNPSFVRCMIYATTYCKGLDENKEPIYDFETDYMKALLKELDYLESRNIEVVFGEWEHPARYSEAYQDITVDSPYWAKVISGLMDYLINEKGYTCIKFYNYVNEANSDWSYCEDYDKWMTGIKYLYEEFDKIGILDKVSIIGPDTVWDNDHTWLKNIRNDSDMNEKIGLYDVHMYPTIDEITNGIIEETVKIQRSIGDNKDFYMTEIGMVTDKVNNDSQGHIREFSYGVIMADAAAQTMRGGFSGVAIWDLDDAMHTQSNGFPLTDINSLKQWGFWNSIASRKFNQPEEENIRPHFYTWSLMTHLFPRHSSIIESNVDETINGLRTVGMKDANGNITYAIINDSNSPLKITVTDNGNQLRNTIYEYRYFDDERIVDKNGYPLINTIHENVDFGEGMMIELPSAGVVFLSTIDTKDQVAKATPSNDGDSLPGDNNQNPDVVIEGTEKNPNTNTKEDDSVKTHDIYQPRLFLVMTVISLSSIVILRKKKYS